MRHLVDASKGWTDASAASGSLQKHRRPQVHLPETSMNPIVPSDKILKKGGSAVSTTQIAQESHRQRTPGANPRISGLMQTSQIGLQLSTASPAEREHT